MLNLPAILKQAEAALKGPWTAELDYVSAFIPGKRPNGEIIGRWQTSISGLLSDEQRQANAEFAAAARTNVPQLVAALQEAQKQVSAFKVLRELILRRPYTADELRERFDAILGESE